jgi:hypothetical protein
MKSQFYLPELHNFNYIALAPWPQPTVQIDWVDQIALLENWLDTRVGPHHTQWAWATVSEQTTREACVAFKWAKHKTLFLLTWS